MDSDSYTKSLFFAPLLRKEREDAEEELETTAELFATFQLALMLPPEDVLGLGIVGNFFHVFQASRKWKSKKQVLMEAIESGDIEKVRTILSETPSLVEEKWSNGKEHESSLISHLAAFKGSIDILKFIIEDLEIDPEEKNGNGETIVHLAARGGHVDVIEYCMYQLGIDENDESNSGWTIMHLAASSNQLEFLEYCIEELVMNIYEEDSEECLITHHAAAFGNLEILKYCIEDLELDENSFDSEGQQISHYCAVSGHLDVLKYCINDLKMDAKIVGGFGSMLNSARYFKHTQVVEYLEVVLVEEVKNVMNVLEIRMNQFSVIIDVPLEIIVLIVQLLYEQEVFDLAKEKLNYSKFIENGG